MERREEEEESWGNEGNQEGRGSLYIHDLGRVDGGLIAGGKANLDRREGEKKIAGGETNWDAGVKADTPSQQVRWQEGQRAGMLQGASGRREGRMNGRLSRREDKYVKS